MKLKVANPTANRERCGICDKFIYTHNLVLVCNLDNKPYHAKCLKICNDTAYELQQSSNWFCPHCLEGMIPFFNCSTPEYIVEKCRVCDKHVSKTNHKIAHCTLCDVICHYNCLTNLLCTRCNNLICNNSEFNLFNDFSMHFDPYTVEDIDDNDYYFDDDVDNHIDTAQIAKDILKNCTYYNSDSIPLISQLKNTTFYFNNIDGFKSNFNEFLNNKINHKIKFDFYCFNETNVKENEPHDFDIESYNCEMLYAIDNKSKGSGIAVYR